MAACEETPAAVQDRVEALSDATVIERSLRRPDAFAALFDRYADELYRYAARRLGPEAGEEIMAETFAIAFQRRGRYDTTRADARPWLYGIVTNLLARHRRAEARRWRAMARTAVPPVPESMGDDVAARVGAQALRGELAAALAALPDRNRHVLLLIAWAELDYAEAAEALGVPVGTVRSRLHRARSALRTALPDTGEEERDG